MNNNTKTVGLVAGVALLLWIFRKKKPIEAPLQIELRNNAKLFTGTTADYGDNNYNLTLYGKTPIKATVVPNSKNSSSVRLNVDGAVDFDFISSSDLNKISGVPMVF